MHQGYVDVYHGIQKKTTNKSKMRGAEEKPKLCCPIDNNYFESLKLSEVLGS